MDGTCGVVVSIVATQQGDIRLDILLLELLCVQSACSQCMCGLSSV